MDESNNSNELSNLTEESLLLNSDILSEDYDDVVSEETKSENKVKKMPEDEEETEPLEFSKSEKKENLFQKSLKIISNIKKRWKLSLGNSFKISNNNKMVIDSPKSSSVKISVENKDFNKNNKNRMSVMDINKKEKKEKLSLKDKDSNKIKLEDRKKNTFTIDRNTKKQNSLSLEDSKSKKNFTLEDTKKNLSLETKKNYKKSGMSLEIKRR